MLSLLIYNILLFISYDYFAVLLLAYSNAITHWVEHGSTDEVLVQVCGRSLRRADLQTLLPKQWIDSEV